MKLFDKFKTLFVAEALLLVALTGGILYYAPEKASSLYLYELIGVVMALMITTGGIYKMRDIT